MCGKLVQEGGCSVVLFGEFEALVNMLLRASLKSSLFLLSLCCLSFSSMILLSLAFFSSFTGNCSRSVSCDGAFLAVS